MAGYQFFDYLIIGEVRTEFIVDLANRSRPDVLGGSALYAAGGLRCWSDRIAVCGHSAAIHQSEIAKIEQKYLIDLSGIQFHNLIQDDRYFLGYITPQELFLENPVAFYASRGLPFPRGLIGYDPIENHQPGMMGSKFLPEDFSNRCLEAGSCLICPFDLMTHLQLTSFLLQSGIKRLVIQSSANYMKMDEFENMPVLMKDLGGFITPSSQLRSLFRNRSKDLWEMAATLGSLGCAAILVYDERFGVNLYETSTGKRYQMPPYPGDISDPTGMPEAFCGGFLAGLKLSQDPREALAYGAVSASLTSEGSGPFYCLESLPSLVQSRLNFARDMIKAV